MGSSKSGKATKRARYQGGGRVFTVGNEEAYDHGIQTLGDDFLKLGKRPNYAGGYALSSVEDAQMLIDEQDMRGTWAIYELDADWEKDTVVSRNGWWRALLRDARIIRKVIPDTAVGLHRFDVIIGGCTREQAERVLQERLGHDEDYGFNYTLTW